MFNIAHTASQQSVLAVKSLIRLPLVPLLETSELELTRVKYDVNELAQLSSVRVQPKYDVICKKPCL